MTIAPPVLPPTARYRTSLATTAADLHAAQRLRQEVLDAGRDADGWAEHCDHLVVRDEVSGQVVATTALLPPDRAAALGRTGGDGRFDLRRHTGLRAHLVEAGQPCVHPGHRTVAVHAQLWAGVARYLCEGGHAYLGGCASVPLADGGSTAAGVWDHLVRYDRLAPAGLWVFPQVPFDVSAPARPERLVVPPVLRGCLDLGARICGRPAHDAVRDVADFYVLLGIADIVTRQEV